MSSLGINSKLLPLKKYISSEQKIGKWIDGKTIYRKVLTFSNTSTQIISNQIDNIIYTHCLFRDTAGDWRTIPWLFSQSNNIGSGSWAGGFIITSTGNLVFQLGSDLENISRGIFIVEYTKQ